MEIHVQWRWPPPEGSWVKLNIDGSASGCPGKAGADGVIRGPNGNGIKDYDFD